MAVDENSIDGFEGAYDDIQANDRYGMFERTNIFPGMVEGPAPVRPLFHPEPILRYVDAVNSIRKDSSGTVYASNGILKNEISVGVDGFGALIPGDQWDVLLHLGSPLAAARAFFTNWATSPYVSIFTWEDFFTHSYLSNGLTWTVKIQAVLDDWDPTTITWSGASGLTLGTSVSRTSDAIFDNYMDNNTLADVDIDSGPIFGTDDLVALGSFKDPYELTTAQISAGLAIHGYRISISGTAYTCPAFTVQGVVNSQADAESDETAKEHFAVMNTGRV